MEIREHIHDETILLNLTGMINAVESTFLTRRIENYRGTEYNRIIIDLTNVDFIDSVVIGGLVYVTTTMKKSGMEIVLRSPNKQVRELISDCNLEKVLNVDTIQDPDQQPFTHEKQRNGVSP